MMENFLKIVEEGANECPAAHLMLGLVPVMVEVPQVEFPFDLKKMKSHFATAAKVRVAARVLARTTLEETCKALQELVDFAAREKFKKRLSCSYAEDDILCTIGAHFLSLRKWTTQLGDAMSDKLEFLENAVSAAMEGDTTMPKFFAISNLPSFMITPLKRVPSLMQLRATYGTSYTLAAPASKFGDHYLKILASNTMQYLRWFMSEAFPGQGLEVPPSTPPTYVTRSELS